jgi:hypothetical protein
LHWSNRNLQAEPFITFMMVANLGFPSGSGPCKGFRASQSGDMGDTARSSPKCRRYERSVAFVKGCIHISEDHFFTVEVFGSVPGFGLRRCGKMSDLAPGAQMTVEIQ